MTSFNEIQAVNSTSYVDILGVYLNLERLPQETTTAYLERLCQAANLRRDHSYEGSLSELSLQLGLSMQPAISLGSTDPAAVVVCSIRGVLLVSGGQTVLCPLMYLDRDNVWTWYKLSDIVDAINAAGTTFTAHLLTDDAPALQLARQSNLSISPEGTASVSWPMELVTSEVAMIGMVGEDFAAVARTPDGALAYQVREALQALLQVDRSYWGK